MNTGKRISLLWAGSTTWSFALIGQVSHTQITARLRIYSGYSLLLLAIFAHAPTARGQNAGLPSAAMLATELVVAT